MSIAQVTTALARHPNIQLAIVFGSVAASQARPDSDVDVAVQAARPLSTAQKMALIGDIGAATGRAVDLIDLRAAGEPLRGQILKHGTRVRGSNDEYADLVLRHLYDHADFMPYVERMLRERRDA